MSYLQRSPSPLPRSKGRTYLVDPSDTSDSAVQGDQGRNIHLHPSASPISVLQLTFFGLWNSSIDYAPSVRNH